VLWDAAKRRNEVLEQLVLVFGWKQRLAHDELEDDAPQRPHVGCVVVCVAQQNLGRPVVPALHVEEPLFAVFATRPEVYYFYRLVALVSKQNVLWLHVAVNHASVLHVFQSFQHLETYPSQLLSRKDGAFVFVAPHILEQIEVQLLKYYNHVLTKLKVVQDSDDPVLTLGVSTFWAFLKSLQHFYFYVRVVHVELLVLAQFGSHHPLLAVCQVHALHHLSESALVDYFDHFVPVPELLSLLHDVLPLFVRQRKLVLPPH